MFGFYFLIIDFFTVFDITERVSLTVGGRLSWKETHKKVAILLPSLTSEEKVVEEDDILD